MKKISNRAKQTHELKKNGSKKFVESIKQGNWNQSISALGCHRNSLFAFNKYTATCISFTVHTIQ